MEKKEKDIARVTRIWKDTARDIRLKTEPTGEQLAVADTLEKCVSDIEHALEKARQRELTRERRQDKNSYRGRRVSSYLDDEADELTD